MHETKTFTFLGREVTARKIAATRKERYSFHSLSNVPQAAFNVFVAYDRENKFLTLNYEIANKNAGKWACNVNGRGRVFDTLEALEGYISAKEKQSARTQRAALEQRTKRGTKVRKQIAGSLRHARALGIEIR